VSGRTAVEDLLRELAPRVLGVLVRRYGDFADAEDAVQEALLAAASRWPAEGLPDNPRGWLITVAVRRLTDGWRSDEARRRREDLAAAREPATPPEVGGADDSLPLLFLCCHPALTAASAIPLTLRAVGGLTTAEIARAFLVPEATMAQRISRAKQRIRSSDVPPRMPTSAERAERLRSVLHVLYLIFNEGYAASTGADVARSDLSGEAIRLARALHAALPDDPEVCGLLALMLLTDARRPARTGPDGELVPLADQDRTLWDRALVAEGVALVSAALPRGAVGDYQLQAAIAAVHDEAATAAETDWRQILALYGLLERMTGNPVVTLNRAVAAAMVDGPAAGLTLLAGLDARLPGHHRLDAVRAHLLEMAGDVEGAIAHYRTAASRTTSLAESRYLTTQAARLRTHGSSLDWLQEHSNRG
jgi:RNA polymerase sigma factor (sigma-70 family)